ncbi:MAG: hypothetical protein ACTSPI_05920, partial [Candidatus Heimdallarchaeaceae archaeon]
MNHIYTIFVKLGHNKNLSKLELSTVLEKIGIKESPKFFEWGDYLFIDLHKDFIKQFFSMLNETGSIVKAGSLVTILNQSDSSLKQVIKAKLVDSFSLFPEKKWKIKIALNIQAPKAYQEKLSRDIRNMAHVMATEGEFQVKIIPKKRTAMDLSPYQYHKENIPKRGFELNFFNIKSKIFFASTTWVTNPFKDIRLDEQRPERLFTHGLSIKLA